jgi:hypothetical protein
MLCEEVAKGEVMPTKPMKFFFVCPTQNKEFASANFSILESRGVIVDQAGNKMLDAKVALNEPCPFCGQKHVYHAGELSCPFEIHENKKNQ